ncbi:hypothetical protein [Arthrobacter sp. SX1312]|uniref:hypothetical protein n=1 Tax=Arthrobacter sp. SX1312 TaxID=2058896 RepID=UPI000CE3B2C7|nr:hypothetical protein [Arthrobacter sp. SX1312]
MVHSPSPRSPFLRTWLLWIAGFIAFPVAGLIGSFVVGRVDNSASALVGGAIAGLIIGSGQTLAGNHRLQAGRWIPATTVGTSAGLLLGASAVEYGTSLADLALLGALNGLVVGACQAAALPRGVRPRWVWAAVVPALWALGWTVTTLLRVRVDEQFIVFGATGALVFATLSGLALHWVVPSRADATPAALPTRSATT